MLFRSGIKERSCININGCNCPEWIIGCLGSIFANMIAAGVYTTNSPDACVYISNHSESEVVLLEDMKQYNKYFSAKEPTKTVKYFIMWGESLPEGADRNKFLIWSEVISMGKTVYEKHKETINERCKKQVPGTVCTFIYTSGTTSMPKACMLTHDALIDAPYTQITTYLARAKNTDERDKVVSYLPLCHVAAFVMDVMVNLMLGSMLYFADADALRGSLILNYILILYNFNILIFFITYIKTMGKLLIISSISIESFILPISFIIPIISHR